MTQHENDVCDVCNPNAASDWLIICEHASDYMPPECADLGVKAQDRHTHIAWDPGAAGVSRHLGTLLDATVVMHRYSRLLFDCNRSINHPDAIRQISEGRPIPGNQGLSADERRARADLYFHPFHDRISALLDERQAAGRTTRLVTVHSFNPTYLGVIRQVEFGVIGHDTDTLSIALFNDLCSRLPHVAWNEPYSAADDVTYTIERHAGPRELPGVMVEIRNDLIVSDANQRAWAGHLATGLARAAQKLR